MLEWYMLAICLRWHRHLKVQFCQQKILGLLDKIDLKRRLLKRNMLFINDHTYAHSNQQIRNLQGMFLRDTDGYWFSFKNIWANKYQITTRTGAMGRGSENKCIQMVQGNRSRAVVSGLFFGALNNTKVCYVCLISKKWVISGIIIIIITIIIIIIIIIRSHKHTIKDGASSWANWKVLK